MKYQLVGSDFRANLVSCLTQLDQHESKRDRNIYRLGHYLKAADDVMDSIGMGKSRESSFSMAFIPTRGMHGIAKALGLKLDVDRGNWMMQKSEAQK